MASSDGVPRAVKFATAGVGGVFGWVVVPPFNTAAVRMNLAAAQPGYLPGLGRNVAAGVSYQF